MGICPKTLGDGILSRILGIIKQRDGIRNNQGLLGSFRDAFRDLSDLRREEDLLRQPQCRVCRNPCSIKGMSP